MNDRRGEALNLHVLGFIAHDMGDLDQAKSYHQQALDLHQALNQPQHIIECIVEIAYITLKQEQLDEARAYLKTIKKHIAQSPKLEGTEYPFRVFLHYYYILEGLQHPQATDVSVRARKPRSSRHVESNGGPLHARRQY